MPNSIDTMYGIVGSQTELKRSKGKTDEHRHSLVSSSEKRSRSYPTESSPQSLLRHDGLCLLKLRAEIDLSSPKLLCIRYLVTAMRKVMAMVDAWVI